MRIRSLVKRVSSCFNARSTADNNMKLSNLITYPIQFTKIPKSAGSRRTVNPACSDIPTDHLFAPVVGHILLFSFFLNS
jgi:hypothetical protein